MADQQLLDAVYDQDSRSVREAIGHGARVNSPRGFFGHGGTPLHRACMMNIPNLEIVQILLRAGADIEARDSFGCTPLMCACSDSGNSAVARMLLEFGANVRASDDSDWTPLHYAASRGYVAIVPMLVERGAELDVGIRAGRWERRGRTPLHNACAAGELETTRALIRLGADLFRRDDFGYTPFDLTARAQSQPQRIQDYLLQQYKDHVLAQERRLTLHALLRVAVFERNVIRLPIGSLQMDHMLTLLRSVVDQDTDCIHTRDGDGNMPIHIASCSRVPVELLRFLAEQDVATLQIQGANGALPLHKACCFGISIDKIRLLVEAGGVGTLSARDNDGNMPLHRLCRSQPPVQVVKYILDQAPETVQKRTGGGDLPVTLACKFSASLDVVFELVRAFPQELF